MGKLQLANLRCGKIEKESEGGREGGREGRGREERGRIEWRYERRGERKGRDGKMMHNLIDCHNSVQQDHVPFSCDNIITHSGREFYYSKLFVGGTGKYPPFTLFFSL